MGDRTLSCNGAKTATCKHSLKSSAINGRAKGGKEKEKLRMCRWIKEKKYEHLKLLNMPCTVVSFYFTKIIKR